MTSISGTSILGWIRIRGSMPLTNGSGSGSGSWIRILLLSSLTFKMPEKKYIFNTIFSAYYFLKLHLHHFSKIKSQKESQNNRIQGFSYYFCMMIEGSGTGRPKNMWIRWIRIRNRNTVRNYPFCLPLTCLLMWNGQQECTCEDEGDEVVCLAAHNAGGEAQAVYADVHRLCLDVQLPHLQSSPKAANSARININWFN